MTANAPRADRTARPTWRWRVPTLWPGKANRPKRRRPSTRQSLPRRRTGRASAAPPSRSSSRSCNRTIPSAARSAPSRSIRACRGTSSAVNVAGVGLSCATDLDAKSWNRSELIAGLEKATRETLAAADKIAMSADDRSGLYESLVDARDEAKDAAAARTLREQWAAFLEGEAAKAKTPDQRAVFDSHRLTAYLGLKQPEKAIPMLEQSERDLPQGLQPAGAPRLRIQSSGTLRRSPGGIRPRAQARLWTAQDRHLSQSRHGVSGQGRQRCGAEDDRRSDPLRRVAANGTAKRRRDRVDEEAVGYDVRAGEWGVGRKHTLHSSTPHFPFPNSVRTGGGRAVRRKAQPLHSSHPHTHTPSPNSVPTARPLGGRARSRRKSAINERRGRSAGGGVGAESTTPLPKLPPRPYSHSRIQ